MNLNGIKREFVSCNCEHVNNSSGSIKGGNFLTSSTMIFSIRASFCGVSLVIFFPPSYMSLYGICVLSVYDLIRNETP
jgi:hypothetical protein